MGKRSRERMTGLTVDERIERSQKRKLILGKMIREERFKLRKRLFPGLFKDEELKK